MLRIIIIFSLFVCSVPTQLCAKPLNIAVAANFAEPMKRILHDFSKIHPEIKTNLIIGSSGKLYAQIKQGAPFDFFLSADQEKPALLVTQNFAKPESLFTYAKGVLVLWSQQHLELDLDFLATYNGKISLANPKFAPYGMAALEILEHYNNSNIQQITANNVLGAFQYVYSDTLPLGLVAKSSLIHAKINLEQSYEIPTDLYRPILQDLVILKQSINAQLLWDFMQSEQATNIIESYGYLRGNK